MHEGLSQLRLGDFAGANMKTINAGTNPAGEPISLTQLKSYDLEQQEEKTLLVSTETALALVEYANGKLADLPADKQEMLSTNSPQAELRRPDFIMEQAKEFCAKFNQPFILESKLDGPFNTRQQLGSASPDGGYQVQEHNGSSQGLWGRMKAWLKLEKPETLQAQENLKQSASANQGLMGQLSHTMNVNNAAAASVAGDDESQSANYGQRLG